jgi:hypothetical protein
MTPRIQRVYEQGQKWVNGNPQHNTVDDECCPDFSCCNSNLFEPDRTKRVAEFNEWAQENGVPTLK